MTVKNAYANGNKDWIIFYEEGTIELLIEEEYWIDVTAWGFDLVGKLPEYFVEATEDYIRRYGR